MSRHHDMPHQHQDSKGVWHTCYHVCRSRWYIWFPLIFIGQILLFPLEHQIAQWVWTETPLEFISDYMGWFDEHVG